MAALLWFGFSVQPVVPAWADAAPQNGTLRFEVDFDGRPIGEHALTFESQPDGSLNVAIDIDLAIKFGPFTVFSYSQQNRTRWRGGQLVSLQSETDDDGTQHRLRAIAEAGALRVLTEEATFKVTASMLPSTYWMASTVHQNQLLNSQTGELLEIAVRKLGRTSVAGPAGAIPATHYRMDGDLEIDLWYDDSDVLVGLAFEARGAQVAYRLVERQGSIPVSMAKTIMNARN
ncbi:MAG: DUF6134 family protein [Proteobacteria bacterium]|nr:DUF6134 family protein [Pseudomonadota bacterium]